MMREPFDPREHIAILCRSRGVEIAVFDFIVHNMSHRAAEAAIRAMPVISA